MADEVVIEIADGIAATIDEKLEAIGVAAKTSYQSVEQLKQNLAQFSNITAFRTLINEIALIPNELAASARTSAAVFSAELDQLDNIARLKTAQIGANFGQALSESLIAGTGKSARESAAVFSEQLNALDEIARLKAVQIGTDFSAALNASFNIGVLAKSAAESASVFVAAEEAAASLAAEVANLRAQLDPAAAALAAVNAEVARYTELAAAGAISSAELAAATRMAEKSLLDTGAAARVSSNELSGLVKLVAGLFAFREIQQGADAYIKLENALHLAGLQGEKFATTERAIFDAASHNGVAVEGLALLYQKLAVAQKILGSSSEQTTQLVVGISAAIRAQGASVAAAQRATTDLAEIFDLNTVSMRQWRGVLIQVPTIAIAAANGITRFHGSVSELTNAILHQKVSSKELFAGLLKGLGDIQELADRTNLTIASSFNVLHTEIAKFIADINKNTGLVFLFTQSIIFLADNLRFIIPIVIALGAAWAAVKFVQLLGDIKQTILAIKAWGLAESFLNTTLIPTIVFVAEFTLGLIAGVAALFAIAALVAQVTGKTKEFNEWLKGTAKIVLGFAKDLLGMGEQAQGTATDTKALSDALNTSAEEAKKSSKEAKDLTSNLAAVGTTATTTAAQTVSAFQRIGGGLDVLIWKMNKGAENATRLFNALSAAGGSSGSFQTAGVTNTGSNSSIQTVPAPTPAFASGGSFVVGGQGGVDKNLVRFRASKGERVDILTPEQQRAQNDNWGGKGTTINFTVVTPDADSFGRSRRQIHSDLAAIVGA